MFYNNCVVFRIRAFDFLINQHTVYTYLKISGVITKWRFYNIILFLEFSNSNVLIWLWLMCNNYNLKYTIYLYNNLANSSHYFGISVRVKLEYSMWWVVIRFRFRDERIVSTSYVSKHCGLKVWNLFPFLKFISIIKSIINYQKITL